METVCLWVLPTAYQPGFLPSQHSPDPAMEWGCFLLFPWINTMTTCSLMCHVNNNHLFLLFLWGAHSGHLFGMWLLLNNCEKQGGQGGKFFQPHWTSKSLTLCTASRTMHFWTAAGKQRETSKRRVKIPGELLWSHWEVRPQCLCALPKGKWDAYECGNSSFARDECLPSNENRTARTPSLMPGYSKSHSPQLQQMNYNTASWAWKQVCL